MFLRVSKYPPNAIFRNANINAQCAKITGSMIWHTNPRPPMYNTFSLARCLHPTSYWCNHPIFPPSLLYSPYNSLLFLLPLHFVFGTVVVLYYLLSSSITSFILSLPPSFTPSLSSSLPPSLPLSFSPSLTPSLPLSLPHSLSLSLTPSLSPSLPHFLPPSLPSSLPAPLPTLLLVLPAITN